MEQAQKLAGTVDHIALKCEDLRGDVEKYQRLGFQLETMYEDWAMLRDAKGFGIALLPPDSKHPPHLGMKIESREALEAAARAENRPLKEHRDKTVSFYTKGIGGQIIEMIYYPADYNSSVTTAKTENK